MGSARDRSRLYKDIFQSSVNEMDELLQALETLNSDLRDDDIELNLNIIGGFSLFLQNLDIEVRPSHDIDSITRLSEKVKERIERIGQNQGIDLRWLNDDVLSLYDELDFAGIDLEEMSFTPSTSIDYSNIHLNVISIEDFLKLKLFSLFSEVFDFMQYNKGFEREQDLQDIKTIFEVSTVDYAALLYSITSYVQDNKYRDLTESLIDTYISGALANTQINDFLRTNRSRYSS